MRSCDEKMYIKDFKSRVSFERRKLDLSIFIFNEPTNDQSFEIIFQGPLTDQSFENLFKDKLKCLDESIRDAFVSYTSSKEIVNSNFEEMYEDELKILSIHVVYAPITFFDNEDEYMKSGRGKKSRKELRKVMNKLVRMNIKMTKRLTSPICPL